MGSYSTFIILKQYCYGREFPLVEIKGSPIFPLVCMSQSRNCVTVWKFISLVKFWETQKSTTNTHPFHYSNWKSTWHPSLHIGWYTPSTNLPKLVSASHLFWPYHQGFHWALPRPMLAIHPWPCRFRHGKGGQEIHSHWNNVQYIQYDNYTHGWFQKK